MPEAKLFVLDVSIDAENRAISLRLTHDGAEIGVNDVHLDSHPAAAWEAVFDTQAHVHRHERAARPAETPSATNDAADAAAAELIEQLGVFIGRHIIGAAAINALSTGDDRRALVVRFPGAPDHPLTSAFAQIPWHMARPALGVRPLMQRNVIVRVEPPELPAHAALSLYPGEPLRVLLVFTEAPGCRPLAARLERERLRALFYDEIMPDNQVMLDILCHGVSRERLRQKLEDAGGYHIIHWSGHGHDIDPLARGPEDEDTSSILCGGDLVDLLAETGTLIPQLVFLGASHSGPLGRVRDWDSLNAWLRDPASAPGSGDRATFETLLGRHGGCGDAALKLLRVGVPQVIAMRHPASGAYTRRLARRFYRSLLASRAPLSADSALALAARELTADPRTGEHHPADHAAAVAFGSTSVRFTLDKGQSPDLELRRPQPQPLLRGRADLDPPAGFSGRGMELGRLALEWLPKRGAAVALIHGAPGIGKTTLAAEAVHLWHRQFHSVFAFQARAPGLSLDDFYRDLDKRLMRASPPYRERCKENEERRVFLPPRQDLSGPERYEILRENLIDALASASILTVIDAFEGNLGSIPVENGYLCSDPEWDALLKALPERLANASGSRVLITSRSAVASLAGSREVVSIEIHPLLANEALSIVEAVEPLRALLGGSPADRDLVRRVLDVSAGHPAALRRLGDLAQEGRQVLEAGLAPLPVPREELMPVLSIRPAARSLRPPAFAATPPPPPVVPGLGASSEAAALAPVAAATPVPPPPETAARDRGVDLAPPTPEKIAERAVILLMERLDPKERSLLWRITRAPAPMRLELIKRLSELSK